MLSKIIVVAALLVVAILIPNGSAQYWYGVNDTVSLRIDSSKVIVKLDGGYSTNEAIGAINRIVAVVEDEHLIDGFIACSLSTGSNYGDFLDSLEMLDGV